MFNLKNLFSLIKSESNYSLNYDFKSIKVPEKNSPKPDYIIAADSGLEALSDFQKHFNKLDLLPDAVLGDMDSLKNKKILKEFSKTAQVEKFNPYKDFTDTELALILASKVKAENTRVTLIGGSGGRLDHLLAIYDLFSSCIAPDVWLTECQILTLLKKDSTIKLLPRTLSSPISVMHTSASNNAGRIESKGLEWESELFRKKLKLINNLKKRAKGLVK